MPFGLKERGGFFFVCLVAYDISLVLFFFVIIYLSSVVLVRLEAVYDLEGG